MVASTHFVPSTERRRMQKGIHEDWFQLQVDWQICER